jgi:hypothetical protein
VPQFQQCEHKSDARAPRHTRDAALHGCNFRAVLEARGDLHFVRFITTQQIKDPEVHRNGVLDHGIEKHEARPEFRDLRPVIKSRQVVIYCIAQGEAEACRDDSAMMFQDAEPYIAGGKEIPADLFQERPESFVKEDAGKARLLPSALMKRTQGIEGNVKCVGGLDRANVKCLCVLNSTPDFPPASASTRIEPTHEVIN